MPHLREEEKKMDDVMTLRVTRRLGARVRAIADRDGIQFNEWVRMAVIEKLNRDERDGGAERGGRD